MRAEKGFIMIGDETDGTVIPQDLGLGWAISKKKADYLGKRAQERSHMADPNRWKLVGLETLDGSVLEDGAYAIGEGVNANGQRNTVGRVTSTYFSPTLGRGHRHGAGPARAGPDGRGHRARPGPAAAAFRRASSIRCSTTRLGRSRMSEPVSALMGRVAAGAVTVRDEGLAGMITLRGDLATAKLRTACKHATGLALPAPGKITGNAAKGLAWMSPDELLVLVPHAEAGAVADQMAADAGRDASPCRQRLGRAGADLGCGAPCARGAGQGLAG